MKEILFQILVIAAACTWIADGPIVQWAKARIYPIRKGVSYRHDYHRLKPFDCAFCLAWWTGLIFFALTGTWYIAPAYAACASLLASWISKKMTSI